MLFRSYGSGKQTRTFCYITDALSGFIRALLLGIPGEPYNIGNPEPELSMLALAERIQTIVQAPLTVDTIDYPDSYPADEPLRRCPDITKSKYQLQFQPNVSLDTGLTAFFDWALAHYSGKQ